MPVVVVESPAKAKTINKYLGSDYTVLASYGHVRDLPSKDGSVDPEHGFDMTWEIADRQQETRQGDRRCAEGRPRPDPRHRPRPGGGGDQLAPQGGAGKAQGDQEGQRPVRRVTFNAITKDAVTQAMAAPREVDMELVEAYLARRALDYLVGFTLSPVLWRKLPGAKSAGRVQSVALRIIVDREMEIEAFRPREYWSVRAVLETPRGQTFEARLVAMGGKKLDRYDLATEAEAGLAVKAVSSRALPSRGWRPSPPPATPRRPS
jgi:DNA topoisomerase-1